MKKLVIICLSGILAINTASAQDIHFSQYFVAPQLINPAGFGVLNSFEGGLQYKGQWNSFTKGYTSMAAFANKSFRKQKDVNSSKAYFSLGLNVIYDKAGGNDLTHFKAELPVNVTKRISNSGFLTAGLYAGFGQLAVGNKNLTWGSQYDGYEYNSAVGYDESSAVQTKGYIDCGAGLSHVLMKKAKDASVTKNVIGFSASHLNKPDYSIFSNGSQPLAMRFNFYEYYHIYFGTSPYSLIPSVMLQYQASTYELVLGGQLRKVLKDNGDTKQSFCVGVFYRMQDMCALNCMIEMNKFSVGLNYDFNVSDLMTSSRSFGGLEVSVRMNSPFKYNLGASRIIGSQL